MGFSERTGDMFAANDLDALAHGVNVKGFMGGIAGVFAKKYPEMEKHYKDLCQKKELLTGQIFPWEEKNGPIIYNLATQYNGGADAQYRHVKKTMKSMLSHAEASGVKKIGIPQIGCGIGGLEWGKTRGIIKNIAEKSPVEVVAFTYEPPKRNFSTPKKNNTLNQKLYDQDNDSWFVEKNNNKDDWFDF